MALNGVLLLGAVWSIAYPARRLWPPPRPGSWQQSLAWVLFILVFALNSGILVLDWNSWLFGGPLRFVVGFPLAVLGALLTGWGVATLGARNSSGLKSHFVTSGPYAFTRNPQYLGDIVLFLGLSLLTNSLYLWITHALTIMVFVVAPLAEESWLEEQYGQEYAEY